MEKNTPERLARIAAEMRLKHKEIRPTDPPFHTPLNKDPKPNPHEQYRQYPPKNKSINPPKNRSVNLIAISGWAQSGKDTVANYLVDHYGFKKAAFADQMREALVRLNPLIVAWRHNMHLADAVRLIGWEELKRVSPDTRQLLQRMGTEVGREMFGQDFWVNQTMRRIDLSVPTVISDCRFQNEAVAVALFGGEIIRVNRNGTKPVNSHVSESALDNYQFSEEFHNDGDLISLFQQVDKYMSSLGFTKISK